MGWVFDHCPKSVTSSARCVLMSIANHSGRYGEDCYPGIETIADEAGMSVRSAQRHIAWLEDHGFIEVGHQAGGGRDVPPDKRPNLYRIIPFCESSPHPKHGVTTVTPRRIGAGCHPRTSGVTIGDERGDNSDTQTTSDPSTDPSSADASSVDDDHRAVGLSSSTDRLDPHWEIWLAFGRIALDERAAPPDDPTAYVTGAARRGRREKRGLLADFLEVRPDAPVEDLARWLYEDLDPLLFATDDLVEADL